MGTLLLSPRPFSALTKRKGPAVLLAEAQFCDDSAVTLDIVVVQVSQLPTPLTDHLQKPAPRVVVLPVEAQMLSEVIDTIGKHRNLHLGGTCVRRVLMMLLDYFRFALCR